jgi:thioredoxin 1
MHVRLLTRRRYAKQYPAARFYKLDIDEVPEVASKLKIRSVPTFLFYKDGQQVDKVGGAVPDEIEAAVVKSLA